MIIATGSVCTYAVLREPLPSAFDCIHPPGQSSLGERRLHYLLYKALAVALHS